MPEVSAQPVVDPGEVDLVEVLRALSDRTRLAIVRELWTSPEKACGTFDVDVATSTLTHHFRILREAGIIAQRPEGTRKLTSLRVAALDAAYPGLLDSLFGRHER